MASLTTTAKVELAGTVTVYLYVPSEAKFGLPR
jgi:hypothetical protein